MIKFILVVNKQGQVRVSQFYDSVSTEEKDLIVTEAVQRCLKRTDSQCSFLEYRDFKLVYRRYAALYFIIGVEEFENELAVLELIHLFVETMDTYFEQACEEDIIFNLEKVYFILDEIVVNGRIIETNQNKILAPVRLLDQMAKRW
ncbi:AP-4 complex subunit sigma-1-like [Tubulanus polymorphus]|uniref:AP-4 complex subunit sigma-1-like n=1 Tax=Tubulanus polymorphus TaxID=672921 RepID=UPI003DA587AF